MAKKRQAVNLIRTNVNLGVQQHNELMTLAHQQGLHFAELVRRAVDIYIDREKKRAGKSKAAVR